MAAIDEIDSFIHTHKDFRSITLSAMKRPKKVKKADTKFPAAVCLSLPNIVNIEVFDF